MEWFALILPVILSIFALIIFKHKLVWWEVLLPIAVSVIVIFTMKSIIVSSLIKDTEYLSDYTVRAEYYEKWDEYIQQTCSSTTCDGNGNCTTYYYDCSYVKTHHPRWQLVTSNGKLWSISSQYYNTLVRRWENQHFTDMNRKFHRIDGDKYYTNWNKIFNDIEYVQWSQSYDNKPQTNHTIFWFESLTDLEKERVYEYPEVKDRKKDVCLGCTHKENEYLRKFNSMLGNKHQIYIFILVYDGEDVSVAELQRRHWQNGNKNELVITVDRNSEWSVAFSWMDDKLLEKQTEELFRNDTLSVIQKINKLDGLVKTGWKRKEFKDFNYIQVEIPLKSTIWIWVITFIVSVCCLIYGVANDIEHD